MISAGEQAGMLETMLQRAADYYETRVDNAIDRLIPLLEPAMMVALGGLVGGLIQACDVSAFIPNGQRFGLSVFSRCRCSLSHFSHTNGWALFYSPVSPPVLAALSMW